MDKQDMGALWARKSKKGVDYFSGVLTIGDVAQEIVVFANEKKNPNQPDWRIYKSVPPVARNDNGTEKVSDNVPF